MSKKKQYDDLYGGVGRAMNFRAKRVLAREVADLDGFDLLPRRTLSGRRLERLERQGLHLRFFRHHKPLVP